MTELLLVRHGRPESGSVDPPLDEDGLRQAQAVARLLADEDITAVVSSGLLRARQTAQIIARETGQTPYSLEGLNEWGLPVGSMTYVAFEHLARDAPQVRAIDEGRFMDFVPDGVQVDEFRQKVSNAASQVLADHRGGRVVVVCHGGTINALVGQVLGISDIFWFNPDYTSVSRLDQRPGGRLIVRSLNEVHHLFVQSI